MISFYSRSSRHLAQWLSISSALFIRNYLHRYTSLTTGYDQIQAHETNFFKQLSVQPHRYNTIYPVVISGHLSATVVSEQWFQSRTGIRSLMWQYLNKKEKIHYANEFANHWANLLSVSKILTFTLPFSSVPHKHLPPMKIK